MVSIEMERLISLLRQSVADTTELKITINRIDDNSILRIDFIILQKGRHKAKNNIIYSFPFHPIHLINQSH